MCCECQHSGRGDGGGLREYGCNGVGKKGRVEDGDREGSIGDWTQGT